MNNFLRRFMPPMAVNMARRFRSSSEHQQPGIEPGLERPSSWYDQAYKELESYQAHYADSPYYPFWCVLVDRIRSLNPHCVLDVGCGPGQFASFLRARGLQKYVGLDFSEVSIRMAKSACASFEFQCEDAFKSELFEKLDYDVLVTTEFLEHVNRDLEILDRIRAGTRVLGSVPNFPHPGHVRFFRSENEVSARYASRFSNFRVDEFLYGSRGLSLFLFEGTRRNQ